MLPWPVHDIMISSMRWVPRRIGQDLCMARLLVSGQPLIGLDRARLSRKGAAIALNTSCCMLYMYMKNDGKTLRPVLLAHHAISDRASDSRESQLGFMSSVTSRLGCCSQLLYILLILLRISPPPPPRFLV